MRKLSMQYWIGIAAISMYILSMIEIPLYFINNGPPPVWNIFTRVLINMFACIGLISFLTGFRNILRSHPHYDGLGTFIFSIGLAFTILTFVADSIQIRNVWVNNDLIAPTLMGVGEKGSLLIYGLIDRLLITVLLVASGSGIIMTRILPIWTGCLGCVVGVFHLIPVPTIFFMTEPSDFYSATGWNIPVAGGLFLIWVLMVSILLIRKTVPYPSHTRGFPATILGSSP
jgi:hypothetical protein